MKRWTFLLLGLLLILGATACSTNEYPAEVAAGFVHPNASAKPTELPSNPSPTELLTPTETPVPIEPIPTTTNIPTPIPTIQSTCWQESGRLEKKQLQSEWMDDPLDYIVYLPPCYDELTDQYFPSLYLFHGQTYTNEHWIDLGVIRIADQLIASAEIAPFLMIFPYDRDHYTPPPENSFGDAVFFDLISTIDQNYRTFPEREYRAIGGISRGGNWAIHIGLPQPGFFSAIGAHSTPVFSTDTNQDIRDWLNAIPLDELPRLFIDTGENDRWFRYTLDFEELLNEEGIPHEWYLYPGFHEDKYWQAHIEQYIRWYADPWRNISE